MAGRFGHLSGGILGLYGFITEHREAVEYDLLTHGGFRLEDAGTPALSWRELHILVARWLKLHATATFESVNGIVWSTEAQLTAMLIDLTASANWQRGGKSTAPKPKPLPRPWLKAKAQTFGRDPIPISQFDDWWDKAGK